MSWQERIERYKQEQVQLQSEAERKRQEEQERQRVENIETIKPLLQVLKDLRVQEMLTEIRDEVWKLGEVTVSPNLNEVTHETPIVVKAILKAEWDYWTRIMEGRECIEEEGVRTIGKGLRITIEGRVNAMIKVVGRGSEESSTIINENTPRWLRERLTEDCVLREDLPYNEAARKTREEIKIMQEIEAKKQREGCLNALFFRVR